MRKSTFYGLTALCGVGSLFFGYVVLTPRVSCGSHPESRVDGDFSCIGSAIKMYTVNNGRPPSTGQGLEALVNEPKTGPKPKRWSRVMDRVPVDPWQTPYRYQILPPIGPQWRWELRSAGPNRVFGGSDDLTEEFESGVILDPSAAQDEEMAVPRPSY
jgi:type II secretion system protein G